MPRSVPLRLAVLATYGFLLLPMALVVLTSVNDSSQFTLSGPFSLRWFRAFFGNGPDMRAMFAVSLPVALAAGLLATVVGTLAAVALVRRGRPGGALDAVLMLPLLVPTILIGVGLYLAVTLLGLRGGLGILVLGHALIGVPYVIRLVAAGLTDIDPAIEDAACSLGCSRIEAFLRTTLPQARTAILSGLVFAFIESFSDVNIALFLAGPGNTTIPIQVYSDIAWQSDPTVSAASAVQMLVVCVLVILLHRLTRRRRARA